MFRKIAKWWLVAKALGWWRERAERRAAERARDDRRADEGY